MSNSLISPPTIAVLLGLLLAVVSARLWRPYRGKLPPGPRSLPIVGTRIPGPYPWRHLAKWTREYGDIYTVWLGRTPLIVVGTVKGAAEIMEARAGILADRPLSVMAGETMSGGMRTLLVPYGDRWRRLRRMLHQGLQPKMAEYQPVQERAALDLALDLMKDPDNFQSHARRYAASVIMTTAYGKKTPTSYIDPEIVAVNKCQHRLGMAARPGTYLVDSLPFLRHFPGQWKRDGQAWHKEELELFSSMVDNVRMSVAKDGDTSCFAAYMLEHQKEYGLSDAEAAYLAGSFFGAGSDTSASAITIAIMAAACFPEAKKKAQEELDAVVGSQRPPNFSDREHLPYITAFVKEAFRWRPVSSGGFLHAATEDSVYNGYQIPKGAAVVGNHWAITRDPLVYPNPDSFEPERFIENPKLEHWTYGFGRRICAGKNVADRSLFITVATLLWSFDIAKARDEQGREIGIDTLAFTDTANSHPLPFRVSITPRRGGLAAMLNAVRAAA